MMVAEKYLNPKYHGTDRINSCTDNNSLYQGYDWDVIRWVPKNNSDLSKAPRQDAHDIDVICPQRFGSSHSGVFFAVMCDGSVQGINFKIDLEVYTAKGTRSGGEVAQ